MLKLMKLELKKFSIGWYMNGAVIATLLMALIISFLPYIVGKVEREVMFQDYPEAFRAITTAQSSIFIVFAAVLISKWIIEEYKFKTITVLFTYPVSRKKLMIAKLLLIVSLTFVTILLSTLFVTIVYLALDKFLYGFSGELTEQLLLTQLVTIVISSIAASGISMIPLFFGMLKKSVPITIVSSLIVVSILGFDTNQIELSQIIAIPITFWIIGILFAYLAVRKVDREELI